MRLDPQKLKEMRKYKRSLTQVELATISGVSWQSIQKYEAGKAEPHNGEKILALAKALQCAPSEICTDDGTGPSAAALSDGADMPPILQMVIDNWGSLTADEQLQIGNIATAARNRETLKKSGAVCGLQNKGWKDADMEP